MTSGNEFLDHRIEELESAIKSLEDNIRELEKTIKSLEGGVEKCAAFLEVQTRRKRKVIDRQDHYYKTVKKRLKDLGYLHQDEITAVELTRACEENGSMRRVACQVLREEGYASVVVPGGFGAKRIWRKIVDS